MMILPYTNMSSTTDAEGLASRVDFDQAAPKGAVWSGSTLFASPVCLKTYDYYGTNIRFYVYLTLLQITEKEKQNRQDNLIGFYCEFGLIRQLSLCSLHTEIGSPNQLNWMVTFNLAVGTRERKVLLGIYHLLQLQLLVGFHSNKNNLSWYSYINWLFRYF